MMKLFRNVILPLVLAAAVAPALAAKEVHSAPGLVKIGTVTESDSTTLSLDQLNEKLAAKAEKAGASAWRVVSAGGNNSYFGSADIYR
jgi:multiple stress resistance protein BhsA